MLPNVQGSDPEINSGQAPPAMTVVMQLVNKKLQPYSSNPLK